MSVDRAARIAKAIGDKELQKIVLAESIEEITFSRKMRVAVVILWFLGSLTAIAYVTLLYLKWFA